MIAWPLVDAPAADLHATKDVHWRPGILYPYAGDQTGSARQRRGELANPHHCRAAGWAVSAAVPGLFATGPFTGGADAGAVPAAPTGATEDPAPVFDPEVLAGEIYVGDPCANAELAFAWAFADICSAGVWLPTPLDRTACSEADNPVVEAAADPVLLVEPADIRPTPFVPAIPHEPAPGPLTAPLPEPAAAPVAPAPTAVPGAVAGRTKSALHKEMTLRPAKLRESFMACLRCSRL